MGLNAWRKLLPSVHFAAYVACVWYGCWYRPTWQHWFWQPVSAGSESAEFYPDWIDGIESIPEQIGAGLNFPAVVAAALSLVPFEGYLHSGTTYELAMHNLTALYVPMLWYLIGRRIDRLSGRRTTPLSKALKAFAVTGMVGLLLLSILVLWSFAEGQRYVMSSLALSWLISAMLAIWFRLRIARSKGL